MKDLINTKSPSCINIYLINNIMPKFKLNPKANIFYDSYTGTKILKGQVVEIDSSIVTKSRYIRIAISNRHIIQCSEAENDNASNPSTELTIAEKSVLFYNLYKKGTSAKSLAKKFGIETLKALCEEVEIEPDENDKAIDLVNALIEDIVESEKKKAEEAAKNPEPETGSEGQ